MSGNAVQIVEVGARDGLQNEPTFIATPDKLELLRRLVACGLQRVEATACVSPTLVPQMADHADILAALSELPSAEWSVLVANERGLQAALSAPVREIALFTAASDAFTKKNINCTIEESIHRFTPLAEKAKAQGIRIRGYISTVVRCPYAGDITPQAVVAVAKRLIAIGCDEISLGDTIGVGTPKTIRPMLQAVLAEIPAQQLAVHFHDTTNTAIENIACALEEGLRIIDSSVGGLGGCPFAPGAGGNIATEKVLQFLADEGYKTGIDTQKVTETGEWIKSKLGRG